jgi:hypothetical protein
MKTTINFSEFRDHFYGIRPDNFSYEGLKILFDYFEEYEESTGDEIELDVIGLCCDFAEASWEVIASDYSIEIDINENEDEQKVQVLDFLADQGALIGETSNSIVYRQF